MRIFEFVKKVCRIPVALGVIILTVVALSGIVMSGGSQKVSDQQVRLSDSTYVDSCGIARHLCVVDQTYTWNMGPFHRNCLLSDTVRIHADGDSTAAHFEKFHSEWHLGLVQADNTDCATWSEVPIAQNRQYHYGWSLKRSLGFPNFLSENRVVLSLIAVFAILAVVGFVSYVNLWAFRAVFMLNYKWLRVARKYSLVILCISLVCLALTVIVSVIYYYNYWLD